MSISKPLVFLGGVTLELPQIRNQVQPVVREGERGPLEEEGACVGPSLESKGVSFWSTPPPPQEVVSLVQPPHMAGPPLRGLPAPHCRDSSSPIIRQVW